MFQRIQQFQGAREPVLPLPAKSFTGENYFFGNLFAFLFKLSFDKQVWQWWRAPNLVPLDLSSLD